MGMAPQIIIGIVCLVIGIVFWRRTEPMPAAFVNVGVGNRLVAGMFFLLGVGWIVRALVAG